MPDAPFHARRVLPYVPVYVVLSLMCLGFSCIDDVPSVVEWMGKAIIPYTFFLLGPPVTLAAGTQGLPVYTAETIILIGLAGLCARLSKMSSDAIGIALLMTGAFWVLCGFLPLIFVM
jgi:hypothetical protein